MKGAAVVQGFRFLGALLACGLGLAGCSAGFGSEAEGVSVEGVPAVATAESSAESPSVSSPDGATVSSEFKRPRDSDGKPIWPDGVVGRGYVIPPQHKDAPPLPQWVKDFNPEMPEAARQPTEAGAKAFAEYAFASDFYEFNTGTTTIGRSIADPDNNKLFKEYDNIETSQNDGEWGRVEKYEFISTSIEESENNSFVIIVNYKLSNPYDRSHPLAHKEVKEYHGAISIYYVPQIGWIKYRMNYQYDGENALAKIKK